VHAPAAAADPAGRAARRELIAPRARVGGALVTGAGGGLGYALVEALRDRGLAPVIGTFRDPARDEALLERARADDGVLAAELDVTSDASVAAAAEEVGAAASSLAVVVNNAGVGLREESILTLPLDEFRRQIETHAFGALRVVRAVLPLLRPGSAIGNISSVVAGLHRMGANYAGYAQAKALQNAITRALAGSLAERAIVVLAIHPGWVATDMGGSNAPVSPEESARGIVELLLAAQPEDSGSFRDYLGRPLGW
jgi:NAD(P)-dependent dehydrogenase (short-subunit alcohol dehydrogenase family)